MFAILANGLLGVVAGMLVNYLADYLPTDRKFVFPYCQSCGKPYDWPKYLLWPRRCPHCGHSRGWRTWIVELCYVLALIYLWEYPTPGLNHILGVGLLIYFGLVIIIDLEHRLILHPVSAFGALIGLVAGSWLHGVQATLLGGLFGLAVMFLLYLGGAWFVRVFSRWRNYAHVDEALGFGDVLLSGVLGLILGWPGIVLGLVVTILLAGGVSMILLIKMLILRRYQPNLTIAYGPFLIASAILLIFMRPWLSLAFR